MHFRKVLILFSFDDKVSPFTFVSKLSVWNFHFSNSDFAALIWISFLLCVSLAKRWTYCEFTKV